MIISPRFLSFFLLAALFAGAAQAELSIERKFSLGGWLSSGNTEGQSLHADFYLNRDQEFVNTVTLKGSLDQESSAGVETMFKIYSSLRYAYSINPKFYNFYKLEGEHDRFQDIDLRLIPTIGIGYWFVDKEDFKVKGEGAVGYDFILGGFSNDLDIYMAANDLNNYRVVNQMNYKIKLNHYYFLKWSLKDEYNNRPAAGIQKNDLRFALSLEYSFKKLWP
jgi:putative salt-induced outer membrane protein YdiY